MTAAAALGCGGGETSQPTPAWETNEGPPCSPAECGESGAVGDDESGSTTPQPESGSSDGAESSSGGDEDDSSEESGSESTGGEPEALEACYLGADELGTTCFPLVEIDPYDYPTPIGPNYGEPVRYLDVAEHDLTIALAPNFLFSEVSDPGKGQYQVIQPHAIDMLQEVRAMAGALIVTSGYRSPVYNAGIPNAAPSSRHMYGDGFDLVPVDATVTPQDLHDICILLDAGYAATYDDGHVHCDWRDIDNDELFYGALENVEPGPSLSAGELEAEIVPEGSWLRVQTSGVDTGEGELSRSWTALAPDGSVIATSDELQFEPPPGTATVEVVVGSLRTFSYGTL